MKANRLFLMIVACFSVFSGTLSADQANAGELKNSYRVTSYLYDTLIDAALTGATDGPDQIIPRFVDKTASKFVYGKVNQFLGVRTAPQRDLVAWWLGVGKRLAWSRYKMGSKTPNGWLSNSLMYNIIPAFTQRTVTNFVFNGLVTALNLHFPAFIVARPYIYLFVAPLVSSFGRIALDMGYGAVYSALENRENKKIEPAL